MPKAKIVNIRLTETQYDVILQSICHTERLLETQEGAQACASAATLNTLRNARTQFTLSWIRAKWLIK